MAISRFCSGPGPLVGRTRGSAHSAGLGERGSVTVGLSGQPLPSSPAAPRYVISGVAVCDEPESEMLELILREAR